MRKMWWLLFLLLTLPDLRGSCERVQPAEVQEPAMPRLMVNATHAGGAVNLSFSPDGQFLISSGYAEKISSGYDDVKVWDVATGRLVRSHIPGSASAFSPDGRLYVESDTGTRTVQMWAVADGRPVRAFATPQPAVTKALIFSPDGQFLVGGDAEKAWTVWEVATGTVVKTLPIQRTLSESLDPQGRFTLDGRRFYWSSEQGEEIWDAHTWQRLQNFSFHRQDCDRNFLPFILDGRYAAFARSTEGYQIRDMVSGKIIPEQANTYKSVICSPDGRYVAVTPIQREDTVQILETTSWKVLQTFRYPATAQLYPYGDTIYPTDLTRLFTPDGQLLAISSHEKTGERVTLWQVKTGHVVRVLSSKHYLKKLAFSPDGRYLANIHGYFKLWDLHTGREVCSYTLPYRGVGSDDPTDLEEKYPEAYGCYSPDSRYLAVSSGNAPVVVLETATGRTVRTLGTHGGRILDLAVSRNGRYLATGSDDDCLVKVWDLTAGRVVRTLDAHTAMVSAVAFSPDSRYLASGDLWDFAFIWDAETG
ncbi:MAG: WD40 repeat domain-containing protein [Armatimonadota bacterium]